MAEFQSRTVATLPAGTQIKTDTVGGQLVEYVKIDVGEAGASVPLTAANFSTAWLGQDNRSVVTTYTDATKATIDHVDFKEGGVTQYTLTLVETATTDTWTRS